MTRISLRQRLKKLFIRPHHLMLVDVEGGKPTRNIKVRLISLILVAVALITAGFILGISLYKDNRAETLIPKHLQLQYQHNQLLAEHAEATALNDLNQQQLETQKQLLTEEREKSEELSDRLRVLESILEARKATGVQLLSTEIKWINKSTLHYNLTLVKGGNYPRRVSGHIIISAQSPDNETVELKLGKSDAKLPFRVETHTFLRGLVTWEEAWQPEKLQIAVFNYRGKILLQTEVSIEGVPENAQKS